VFPALIKIIALIEREIGDKIVIIRANNSRGEFRPEFQRQYKEKGMQFEPCPLYKHSINGVSEQAIYIVDYKIRLLLFNIGLLIEFWCLALEYTIWIKNRVPISALLFGEGILGTAKTPFKAYIEKVPNMENLKAFGYTVYPKIKGTKPRKLFPWHRPGFIFVGIKGSLI
jgi:hypothetical protein